MFDEKSIAQLISVVNRRKERKNERLVGLPLARVVRQQPETQLEKKNYKKAKWQKSLFIPGGYTRAAVKKK